ncbi:MAG: hypothetical protein AAFW98_14645 [Pseudomonadota bacterium]
MRTFLLLILILSASGAFAHETSEERLRVVIVSENAEATAIYLRIPVPLLFAKEAAARVSPAAAVEAPFLQVVGDGGAHYLDQKAIERDPQAFKARVLHTIAVTVDGRAPAASVQAFAVHHAARLPPFGTPTEALAAIKRRETLAELHIADAYVDAHLAIRAVGSLLLAFPLDAIAFPGHVHLDNVFVDARIEPPEERVRLGAITEPVEVTRP